MSQTTLARVRAAEVPQITPDRATTVATAEYEALPALLRTLSQDDWLRATDCTGWTVRDVVAHLVGALDEADLSESPTAPNGWFLHGAPARTGSCEIWRRGTRSRSRY
jgi:uncharacterized protein (TIGR03083 family)